MQCEAIQNSKPTTHLFPPVRDVKQIIADIVVYHHHYMVTEMAEVRKQLFELAHQNRETSQAFQLAKLFDRFARDFTRHMDTEERILFPLILTYLRDGHVSHLRGLIDDNELHLIEHEDRTVGCEFNKIRSLVQNLSLNKPSYAEIMNKLEQIQLNLDEHTRKEQQFVAPLATKILRRVLG